MGAASGVRRDTQRLYNDEMAKERLVSGAALPNGAVGCRIPDDVVVVVAVEKRRFARAIKVGAGADSGGRPTKLLKVAASGRGVAATVVTQSCHLDVE